MEAAGPVAVGFLGEWAGAEQGGARELRHDRDDFDDELHDDMMIRYASSHMF